MAKETAEQKLLKLIESTDSQQADGAGGEQYAQSVADAQNVIASVRGGGLDSVVPLVQKITLPFKGLLSVIQNPAAIGVKEVNKLLVAGIAILAMIFVTDFVKNMRSGGEAVRLSVTDNMAALGSIVVPRFKDLAEYASVVSQRNIFHPFEKKIVEEKEAQEAKVPNQRILDKTGNFKVVGISWLDTPESATVMIEDAKTQVTHFLKTGDTLQGVKVKTIYADQVILSYEGETVAVNL